LLAVLGRRHSTEPILNRSVLYDDGGTARMQRF
jgi:hypothetical protein